MDGYLCFNIYKGWMKSKSQVCGSSKEVSAKRKRDKDEVEDVDKDSELGGSVVAHGGSNAVSIGIVAKFNFRCA